MQQSTQRATRPIPFIIAAIAAGYLVASFGWDFVVSAVAFVGILLFLVIMHELGHFTVARLVGVRVLEFGVGLPPKAWGIQRGETEYTVNWLPIGGFVRMLGEEDPSDPRSLASQAAWKRIAVFAAGPAVNLVLPIALLFVALLVPRTVVMTDVVVVDVIADSPADVAGVERGDIVREAAGNEILNSTTLQAAVQTRLGAAMRWVVERNGQLVDIRIDEVRADPPEGQGATGIVLTNARVTVTEVTPGSTAETVGIQGDDVFLLIGRSMVLDTDRVDEAYQESIAESSSEPVTVTVLRDADVVELTASPELGGIGGFTADVRPEERHSESVGKAFTGSFVQLWDILVTFRNEIVRIIAGQSQFNVAGPVGIAQITGDVVDAGLAPLVTWAALLSINLAIVNFLPFPALDGGRIAFVLVELARGGRRISPELERAVHMAGFALLMAAILLVTYNDIGRIIDGLTLFDG